MRVAYADPPYPGQAKLYEGHADYAGEVDHGALIGGLVSGFDPSVRVLAWIKPWASWKPGISPAYAWEPVLIDGARPRADANKVRDFFECHPATEWDYPGAKPRAVCSWVFAALGLVADDVLVDLFPGSGAIAKAWAEYRAQAPLDLRVPAVTPGQLRLVDE